MTYSKWLTKTEETDNKIFCKYCKTQLAAKLGDNERHRNSVPVWQEEASSGAPLSLGEEAGAFQWRKRQ